MLLCLDVGNSNITVGLFRRGEECPFCRGKLSAKISRSADEYAVAISGLLTLYDVKPEEISGCVIGSVVPALTGLLQSALELLSLPAVLTVGPGVKTGFGIRIDDPAELGADLVANTAAAVVNYGAPLIVIDAGTATTISLVDENRYYRGTCILPGLRASAELLKESTALLPSVSLSPLTGGETAIGNNSVESIEKGLLWGNAILVDGFIEKYRGMLTADPAVVATGGSAPLFLEGCKSEIRYDPDLTLKGLRRIWQLSKNRKK